MGEQEANKICKFVVLGKPQPQGSHRAFMPKGARFPVVTDSNRNLKQWRDLTSVVAQNHAPSELYEGPVLLRVDFFFQRPKSLPKKVVDHLKKPDLSKLIRSIEDSLTNIVWGDDSQVVEIIATKSYGTPRAEIQVSKQEQEKS